MDLSELSTRKIFRLNFQTSFKIDQHLFRQHSPVVECFQLLNNLHLLQTKMADLTIGQVI